MSELQVAICLDSSLNFKHMRIERLSSSDYASTDVRNRYKYNGKELFSESVLDWLNYGARFYDAAVGRWWVRDPKAEKYYALTPYSYVGGNVVNAVDLWGMDTVPITLINRKWVIGKVTLSEGDDVFIVNNGEDTKTYTFSEGEYEKRFEILNVENNDDYTLGVYHISGTDEEGSTGYVVTPGGEPSTEVGSGKRLPDGTYDLLPTPDHNRKWVQPWVEAALTM